jgi:hypothetical protein
LRNVWFRPCIAPADRGIVEPGGRIVSRLAAPSASCASGNGYPLPADELVVEEESGGSRRFLSGPLEFGRRCRHAELHASQGTAGYGHPVRTLVPTLPLAELVERGVAKEAALDDLRRFDHLINSMYLPPLEVDELEFAMPGSVALLYMPVTLHDAFLEGQPVWQLAYRGAQQPQRKLAWFFSGWLEDDLDAFDPPMD